MTKVALIIALIIIIVSASACEYDSSLSGSPSIEYGVVFPTDTPPIDAEIQGVYWLCMCRSGEYPDIEFWGVQMCSSNPNINLDEVVEHTVAVCYDRFGESGYMYERECVSAPLNDSRVCDHIL